jgi:ABC-type glycerol-3-phosphate transport system permease component
MTDNRNPVLFYLTRALIYALLLGFAFIILFPFTYMMMSSLKTSSDVFHSPPRLLPYSPITTEYEGEEVAQYNFEIDGEVRQMVPTGERIRYGYFTTEDRINFDNARDSEVVMQVPLDEAVEVGEVALTAPNGETKSFDTYEVTVDGETRELLLAYRGALTVFVDPDNPEVTALGVERTAEIVEVVDFQTENYNAVFDLNLDRALVNTTIVTLGVVIGQLITSIFGGYAFSRLRFRGRDALFVLYLGSIMIPFVVLVIPMYRLMVAIGWEGRLVSLIVPWIFTAYGTFLMRQFFITIPKELEEAALMDGASRMRVLWTIFVPLSTPAVATLAIFSFLYAWNSFLWPLLIIGEGNEMNHVLTLSLIRLSNAYADQPNFVLTGAAVAILPPIFIFILAQRYFIEGVATSGLKG